MLSVDRDALLCDLAETYGVYDLNALPVETLAALSFGLEDDSRIKSKLLGVDRASTMQMLASIADSLMAISYMLNSVLTDKNDAPKPKFFQDIMYANVKRPKPKAYKFASSEEFKKYWSSI